MPVNKLVIRTLDAKEMKALAAEALEMGTAGEVRELVLGRIPSAGEMDG